MADNDNIPRAGVQAPSLPPTLRAIDRASDLLNRFAGAAEVILNALSEAGASPQEGEELLLFLAGVSIGLRSGAFDGDGTEAHSDALALGLTAPSHEALVVAIARALRASRWVSPQ